MSNNLPSWDLSGLFSSIEDPKIFQLIDQTKKRAVNFKQQYSGNLEKFSEAGKLLDIIKEYEAILSDAVKPQAYSELVFTVETNNAAIGAFLQKVRTSSVEIFSHLLFFELELINLPDEVFEGLLNNEELDYYRNYLEKMHAWKIHRLSEKEERILEFKNLTSKEAFSRLFEQELSRQKFILETNGSKKELNESEILNLLYTTPIQEERRKAAESFTKGLLERQSVLTFVSNTLAEDKKIEDELKKFTYPEQSRHLQNQIERDAVEAMAKVVEDNYSMVQEYYKLKKDILGLEKLFDYDRYAPINTGSKTFSFQEAKEIVLEAFGKLDEEFKTLGADFFEGKYIDAALKDGKRGGAYCSGFAPDEHSYVFMNFTGSTNDVMTLAHELGHGIHDELARKQTILNYYNPLTVAETASIFAETLAFSSLIETEKDEKVLLGLYMQKLESIFASVQRQTSMFRFEQDYHNAYRKNGELSSEQINVLWRNRQEQMYGDSVELTPDYDSWWMYIPHFIQTPFYVYAYAFGELLAFGLFEQRQMDKENFYKKYRQFLQSAGSKSPSELAKIFNINLNDPEFWRSSMKVVESYLLKIKELSSKLNQ